MDDNGYVHCYYKAKDRFFPVRPSEALTEMHIYSLSGHHGENRFEIEHELANFDRIGAALFRGILHTIRQGKIPSISERHLAFIKLYFVIQFRRSRPSLKRLYDDKDHEIKEMIHKIDEKLKNDPDPSIEFSSITNLDLDWDRLYNDAIPKSILFREIPDLSGKGYVIGRVKNSRKSLVIGDNPVLFRRSSNLNLLEDPKSEMFMPISSDVVISITGDSNTKRAVIIEDSVVNNINNCMWSQCDAIASPSERLVMALKKRKTKVLRRSS